MRTEKNSGRKSKALAVVTDIIISLVLTIVIFVTLNILN